MLVNIVSLLLEWLCLGPLEKQSAVAMEVHPLRFIIACKWRLFDEGDLPTNPVDCWQNASDHCRRPWQNANDLVIAFKPPKIKHELRLTLGSNKDTKSRTVNAIPPTF